MPSASKPARVPLTQKVEDQYRPDFAVLLGKVCVDVTVNKDDDNRITFTCADGSQYCLYHCQDCCESVVIEDICGDILDLVGEPILLAEEACSRDNEDTPTGYAYQWAGAMGVDLGESNTWTFYKLATIKGCVTIRWHGSSNGYYSESVDFVKLR